MKARKLLLPISLSFIIALFSAHSLALQHNGTAIYNEFGNQVFIGTLFLDMPTDSSTGILTSTQRKRMELRFSGEMSKRRWTQTWTQSIAINSPREQMVNAGDDLSQTLSAFHGNLEPGDTVIFDYDPLSGTSVSVNGVALVEKKSPTLFNLFLSSWIGPVPPNTQFKNAILGKADSKGDYATFQAISPSQVRMDAVKSWNTSLKEEQERALAEAKAEEEAMQKAEEQAKKQAELDSLEEQQRQSLIEEEKRKAQKAARQAVIEAEAARNDAELAATQIQTASPQNDDDAEDLSVESILAQQDYTAQIISKIYKSVRYPGSAVKRNQEGSVRASVIIDRGGNVTSITLIDESEFTVLNTAVINAIKDAAPFSALPQAVRGNQLELTIPVAFKLN